LGNEIVVQWRDLERKNVSFNEEVFSFQIRLNTSTGEVKCVYAGVTGLENSNSDQPQVGLRGPNNTFPTNVNNRTVTTAGSGAGSSWANSAAGTANNSTCRFTSGTNARFPAAGQTYTWTPPCTQPTVADAGTDQTICSSSSATLSANTPSVGSGAWSVVSGPSTSTSQFSSTSDPAATFTPAGGAGTYTLRWTISNSPCPSRTDDVVITVNAPPATANAGGDQAICDYQTATLAANSASPGTGAWSVVSGPSTSSAQFSSTSSPTAVFDPAGGAGTYTLRWTTSNSPCASTVDDVAITVHPSPMVSATSNSPVCEGSTITFDATHDIGTSLGWTGPGGFTSSMEDPSIANAVVGNAGLYIFTATSANGCAASALPVVVAVNPKPVGVSALSSAASVCSSSNTVDLNSNASATKTILSETWNSGANGWTTTNTSTGGTPADAAWILRPNSYSYTNSGGTPSVTTFNSNDNSQFYLSNSDDQGSGSTTATTLVSPVFSTSGFSSVSLTFHHYYRFNSGASDRARVEVSTDGTNWTTLQTYLSTQGASNAFAQATVSLNSVADQPVVYVRFRYAATWDWYWAVDNVTITGTYATPFAYAWSSLPTGFSSSAQNPTGVAVTQNTTFTVTVTTPDGCSESASVPVVYVIAPNAGDNGSTTVCTTSAAFDLFDVLLGTPDVGGNWTLSGSPVSSTFTPGTSAPGTYTYTVAGIAPCANAAALVTVNVNTQPDGGTSATSTVCSVDPAFDLFTQLGGTPTAGGTWTFGGSPVSSTYTPGTSIPGTYTYTVSGTAPCVNDSSTVTIGEDAATPWYDDTDGDGFGDPGIMTMDCTAPAGFVADNTDDCPLDGNKHDPGNCGCGVEDLDTDGDLTPDCSDGCPNDPFKTAPGICGCDVPDTDSDGDGTADCNDGCPLDPNKLAPGNCGCGAAEPGTACDDGSPLTGNDVIQANCTCQGQVIDCLGVAGGPNLPGSPCNDGNSATINDTWNAACTCAGTPITCANSLVLQIQTDANGEQTNWEILPLGGGTAVCSGPATPYADNTTINEACCLPNGCYELKVYDSFGDGMTTGGFMLALANGDRLIDNTGNGSFGALSHVTQGFCLPISTDRLISTRCDMTGVNPADWIQAVPNQLVSAQYGINNTNSGYQFWFFDPHGGYSRRVFISHAYNNYWFPYGPTRASYFKLNSITTSPLPVGILLNVRVRAQVAGVYGEFGPTCTLTLACPTTQLVDDVYSANHSCGRTGIVLDNGEYLYVDPVYGANKYQWEFTRTGYLRRIATTGSGLAMTTWSTNPLSPGLSYAVRVRVSFDGGNIWCNYGPSCPITLAAPAPFQGGGLHSAAVGNEPGFRLWPNPNRGDHLYMELTKVEEGVSIVYVEVYDLFGKRVMDRAIPVEGAFNTVIEMRDVASGMYTVNTVAGTKSYTERLVIQ
jgi:hypothetical protein